jgi:hypothetical protein
VAADGGEVAGKEVGKQTVTGVASGESTRQIGFADESTTIDNRKIIRTGQVNIVVASYDAARDKLDALLVSIGGYVDATQVNRRQDAVSDATLTVRIPATSLGGLMTKLRDLGEITSESTNASDITDQYVDVAARLSNAQTLEKRLLELAADRNGKIDQLLQVERELANVRTEIEGYQTSLKQWNDRIAMTTLTLALSTQRPEIAASAPPSMSSRTSQAFHDSIATLRAAGIWLVVNGIAFLPWLVLVIPGLVIGRKLARRLPRLPWAIVHRSGVKAAAVAEASAPATSPPAA